MDEVEKPKDATKEDDRILVTRAILEEVKASLGYAVRYSDALMLSWMKQMTGRQIELVEELPKDDDIVTICSLIPVVPGSRMAECSECGATIYHSRNAPPTGRKICTRCGPRLGQ